MEVLLLEAAEASEERALAVCMALHPRLGSDSIMNCLDDNIVRMVSTIFVHVRVHVCINQALERQPHQNCQCTCVCVYVCVWIKLVG